MAYYLYNGVQLPDISGAWDNLIQSITAYKLSYGVFVYAPEEQLGVRFYATAYPWRYDGVNVYSADSKGTFTHWAELEYHGFEDYDGFMWWKGSAGSWADPLSLTPGDCFWTSHDILNTDGTVFLAASDPIPVTEPEPIDPTSMLMGWLVGRQIAGMRGKEQGNE